MKIRKGFVSNSSTSSFLIYGVYDPQVSIEKLLAIEGLEDKWVAWYKGQQERWDEEHPEWYPDTTFKEWAKERVEAEGLGELFSALSEWLEIECKRPPYDEIYLGLDPRSMTDDETMGEFKTRVKETLGTFVEGEFECIWHKEAWRDG